MTCDINDIYIGASCYSRKAPCVPEGIGRGEEGGCVICE